MERTEWPSEIEGLKRNSGVKGIKGNSGVEGLKRHKTAGDINLPKKKSALSKFNVRSTILHGTFIGTHKK